MTVLFYHSNPPDTGALGPTDAHSLRRAASSGERIAAITAQSEEIMPAAKTDSRIEPAVRNGNDSPRAISAGVMARRAQIMPEANPQLRSTRFSERTIAARIPRDSPPRA